MDYRMMAKVRIKEDEGLRLHPYECTAGALTIGYGHNLDSKGIPQDVADRLLEWDLEQAVGDCRQYSYFGSLNDARKSVLVEMAFNLGASGFASFKKMHRALIFGDYELAADEIKDSLAYRTNEGLRRRYEDFSDRMRRG